MWFDPDIGTRAWWIDGGDEAPIAIAVGDGDSAFVERSEEVLASVVFETVGPIPSRPKGTSGSRASRAMCPLAA